MTEGPLAEAAACVLTMHPDVPGVGRLAQELLAEFTGLPLAVPVAPPWPLRTVRNAARGICE